MREGANEKEKEKRGRTKERKRTSLSPYKWLPARAGGRRRRTSKKGRGSKRTKQRRTISPALKRQRFDHVHSVV